MFYLLRKRYPYLGIAAGVVLITTGVALHGVTFEVIGAVALALGVAHSITAWRKGDLIRGEDDRRTAR
ncbi:MAG TPA: hypothetical protein VIX86_17425 [Streptosporangiaceae bacterium]